MSITVVQKSKMLPVLLLLRMLTFVEVFFRKLPCYLVRFGILGILVVVLFRNFPVKSVEYNFYRYSGFSVFNPYGVVYRKEIPYIIKDVPFPDLSARSFVVVDILNGKVLLEKDSHLRLAPASTTKLMTALVALDLYEPDEVIAVPEFCTTVEGTKLGLQSGEKILVRDLVYGLLVSSSNDVACVLANSKVSSFRFVELMNEKVKAFGISDTHFTNPVGLDGAIGSHYSSAYDLYILARRAIRNTFVKEVVKTREYVLASGGSPRKIYTTNYLLWAIPESAGVKTGRTEAAGEVLIYEYTADITDLIIVVMGSEDRFLDTRKLLDWTLVSYSWDE